MLPHQRGFKEEVICHCKTSSYLAGHARWKISSTSSMIGSVTSWTINEKWGWCIQCSIFFFCPVKKLSRTITSCPSIMSLSVKWEPTNPAPPVINIFLRLESGRIVWNGVWMNRGVRLEKLRRTVRIVIKHHQKYWGPTHSFHHMRITRGRNGLWSEKLLSFNKALLRFG